MKKLIFQMRKAAISIIADRITSVRDQASAHDLMKLYDLAQVKFRFKNIF